MTVLLVTLGDSAMYVVSVVLPVVQAEFGIGRGSAALPCSVMMLCLGAGGLITGRWSDRWGIAPVLLVGAAAVGGGYLLAALSNNVCACSAWRTGCWACWAAQPPLRR